MNQFARHHAGVGMLGSGGVLVAGVNVVLNQDDVGIAGFIAGDIGLCEFLGKFVLLVEADQVQISSLGGTTGGKGGQENQQKLRQSPQELSGGCGLQL